MNYTISGTASEPHAEKHMKLKGRARSQIKCSIPLYNENEVTKTYKVDSDLIGVQGETQFVLKPMKGIS